MVLDRVPFSFIQQGIIFSVMQIIGIMLLGDPPTLVKRSRRYAIVSIHCLVSRPKREPSNATKGYSILLPSDYRTLHLYVERRLLNQVIKLLILNNILMGFLIFYNVMELRTYRYFFEGVVASPSVIQSQLNINMIDFHFAYRDVRRKRSPRNRVS